MCHELLKGHIMLIITLDWITMLIMNAFELWIKALKGENIVVKYNDI